MSRGEALSRFSVESDGRGEQSGRAVLRMRMIGTAGTAGLPDNRARRQ
jgi:hypothetical protein